MAIATSNRRSNTDSFSIADLTHSWATPLASREELSSGMEDYEHNASLPIVPSRRKYLEVPFDHPSMSDWYAATTELLGAARSTLSFDPDSIMHRETTTASATYLQDTVGTTQPLEHDNYTEDPWSESLIRMQRAFRARSLDRRDAFLVWERLTQLTDELSARWLERIPIEVTKHVEVSDHREFDKLASELRASFLNEPVEDGFTHPAEDILAEALSLDNNDATLGWLLQFSTDEAHPTLAAYTLQCLGRLETGIPFEWRRRLVRAGLQSPKLAIRDVAAQAVDTWGDRGLVPILKAHQDPVPWLAEYISDIITDLSK